MAASALPLIAIAVVAAIALSGKKKSSGGGGSLGGGGSGTDNGGGGSLGVEDCPDCLDPVILAGMAPALAAQVAAALASAATLGPEKLIELAANVAKSGAPNAACAAACLKEAAGKLGGGSSPPFFPGLGGVPGTPGGGGGSSGPGLPGMGGLPAVTDQIPSYLPGSTKVPPFPTNQPGEHGILFWRPGDTVSALVRYYNQNPSPDVQAAEAARFRDYNGDPSFVPKLGFQVILPNTWQPYLKPLPKPGSSTTPVDPGEYPFATGSPLVYPQLPSVPPIPLTASGKVGV